MVKFRIICWLTIVLREQGKCRHFHRLSLFCLGDLQGCRSTFIFCGSGSSCLKNAFRIQLKKKKITLRRVFFSCKTQRLLKSKKQWSLCKFFNKLNKLAVITNFLAFFYVLFEKFSLLDPDPGGKGNADPDPQPCDDFCLSFFGHIYCIPPFQT